MLKIIVENGSILKWVLLEEMGIREICCLLFSLYSVTIDFINNEP
jgi:hypothetical protein